MYRVKSNLFLVGILTLMGLLMFILMPPSIVEHSLLPFFFGILFSIGLGPTPLLFFEKVVHFFLLSTTLILFIFFSRYLSVPFYLLGITAQKFYTTDKNRKR